MATKKKTFDAVEMVREIRDRHHEQLRGKTVEQQLEFYRKKSEALRSELRVSARGRQPADCAR